MEFDEIVVKESPGLCRCCLSEGCYKDLGTEYNWMDDTEVYADMLLECFDISISQHIEGPNGPNRLICEVCITRLRDACNFKKQVLDSEKKFVDMVGRGEFKSKVIVYQDQMKSEMVMEPEPEPSHDADVEYLDEEVDYDDGNKDESNEPTVSEDITVDALPIKAKRGRPRKGAVKPDKKKAKLEEKTKKKIVKGAKMCTVEDRYKKTEMVRKLLLKRRNVEYVLQYSNVTPFMWYKGKYRCFYCAEPMKDPVLLREHTARVHQFANLELVVYDRTKNNRNRDAAVKIDVTDICCKLCPKSVNSLEELIHHLIIAHDAEYDVSVPNCLLPFKLDKDQPTCPICNMKFVFFEYLLRHANKHHLAHDYICDVCGTSFQGMRIKKDCQDYSERLNILRKNILLLLQYGNVVPFHWNTRGFRCFYCGRQMKDCETIKEHTLLSHKSVDLHAFIPQRIISKDVPVKIDVTDMTCKLCNVPLATVEDLIAHIVGIHEEEYDNSVGVCVFPFILNKDVIQCVLCDDKYDNFTTMLGHMYKKHIAHTYICQICGLSFINQVRLKRHISNSHEGHRCKLCGKVFDASHKVDKHKQRIHGIQRTVECNLCSGIFENQYQLKVHMGKVHNVEKYRIKCEHCPKICTTKGAMLLHVQSLHSDARFECDLCEYKTGIKWMIKLHRRKHFGEKNYICSICDRRFGRSSNLRAHMKVHTGSFGRVCRWCRQGFTDSETLDRHEKELHYFNQYN